MEIAGRNILGSPVFALDKGENLGQVKDYIFNPERKAVDALVIAGTKRFGEDKLLPLANIKALGQGAVTIVNSEALISKGDDPELAALVKQRSGIMGITVITTNGGPLGKATDFFMDSKTGVITCIALGGKSFDRFIRGNNFLAGDMVEVFGSDVILAKENAVAATVKPGEPKINIKTENPNNPNPKEAYSGSLWNHGKEKILAKTKEYAKKAPLPTGFNQEEKTKENPSVNRENRFRTKGRIFYKDQSVKKDENPS